MTTYLLKPRALRRGGALGAALSIALAGSALAKPVPPAPAAAPPPPAATASSASVQSLAATAIWALSDQTSAPDSSSCVTPILSQPFTSFQDSNWYTLAPGQSPGSFDGGGWTLLNGASIQTATHDDGQSGSVLDLPSGAVAVSPPMCVDSDYPTARAMVQSTGTTQVAADVFYADADPHQLQFSGVLQSPGSQFGLSIPLRVHPGDQPGWQMVRFVFGTTGSASDGQIYDFYVDPRMCR